MVVLVLVGVLVAGNFLKTITTDKLYQRVDYFGTLIYAPEFNLARYYTQHYSLNFGSEKIRPRTIKLAYA